MAHIKKRNPVFVIVATILTCGLYSIYWLVVTKDEINSLGAQIPTAWLILVPIANLYFMYKYCEGFSLYVKKDDNAILWFLIYFFIAPLAMILFQVELNKLATYNI
jgi:hypothetical protein